MPVNTLPLTFTEAGSVVILDKTTLGYDPLLVFGQHLLQVDTLAGGSVAIDVMGPLGSWSEVVAGLPEDGLVVLGPRSSWSSTGDVLPQLVVVAMRLRFVGTGAAGRVGIRSSMAGFGG